MQESRENYPSNNMVLGQLGIRIVLRQILAMLILCSQIDLVKR